MVAPITALLKVAPAARRPLLHILTIFWQYHFCCWPSCRSCWWWNQSVAAGCRSLPAVAMTASRRTSTVTARQIALIAPMNLEIVHVSILCTKIRLIEHFCSSQYDIINSRFFRHLEYFNHLGLLPYMWICLNFFIIPNNKIEVHYSNKLFNLYCTRAYWRSGLPPFQSSLCMNPVGDNKKCKSLPLWSSVPCLLSSSSNSFSSCYEAVQLLRDHSQEDETIENIPFMEMHNFFGGNY